MNGEWYELFVKADDLFSDPRYDTRVCASNAREVHHNARRRIATAIVTRRVKIVLSHFTLCTKKKTLQVLFKRDEISKKF